jgi:ectoine hydroxylase-related dioxygenase (phytanoyl-CoA dioxygenase family)
MPAMDDLEGNGYAVATIVLGSGQCDHIASSLPAVIGAGKDGVRNLISHPTVVRLLQHERLGAYLWSVVGRDLVAVKATLFDRETESNWRVRWHQDRSIAVKERLDVAGYGHWKLKAGWLHVEPPAEVLAQMLVVRVHLDPCGTDNGPTRVVPGSHRLGKLTDRDLAGVVADGPAVEVHVPQGAMLLMRPLLVHASMSPAAPEHRRVLHLEFAPPESISPLQWRTALPLKRAA